MNHWRSGDIDILMQIIPCALMSHRIQIARMEIHLTTKVASVAL